MIIIVVVTVCKGEHGDMIIIVVVTVCKGEHGDDNNSGGNCM